MDEGGLTKVFFFFLELKSTQDQLFQRRYRLDDPLASSWKALDNNDRCFLQHEFDCVGFDDLPAGTVTRPFNLLPSLTVISHSNCRQGLRFPSQKN